MELDASKNAMQNLSAIYDELKKAKAKRARILAEIAKTEAEIEKEKLRPRSEGVQKGKWEAKKSASKPKKKKGWWSEYRSFETSGGFRAAAGKHAAQNDELFAKHLEEGDLFFHAAIRGGAALILKGGEKAGEQDLNEAAQWGCCYSSAWKIGAAAVDIYAVGKSQVSKHSPSGGHGGKGAFFLTGERKWFRKTELKLKIGKLEGEIIILPFVHICKLEKPVEIKPGSLEKEEAATKLSAYLGCKKDEVLQLLPNGGIALSI
jgi:predicted ribosome quality control (RQC) complex YloA/Tae2 family protein